MGLPKKKTFQASNNNQAQKSSHSSKTKMGISAKKAQSDCHQNQTPNVSQIEAQRSFIFEDGLNNSAEQTAQKEFNLVKRPDDNKKGKDRLKPCDDAFERGFHLPKMSKETWSVSELYRDYSGGDIANDEESNAFAFLECDYEEEHSSSKQRILSWATSILSLSPTARRLVKEASKNNWEIGLENLNGPDFHLDIPEKTITLDMGENSERDISASNYFSSILIISLIRSLRDIWQEKRNGAFDEDYTPESVITLERIRAADLDVIAVLVAWELRCEGYNDLWRHILGSDDADLAICFSDLLERDPTSTFTNKALSATFTQWFKSEERIKACDHETLDYMDEILATSDIQNPFGNGEVQKIDIERLSTLPDKTAYLQDNADAIVNNPVYAGMSDEINKSHLMHILYDVNVTTVQNVPFRDQNLAMRIFPNGLMTPEESETIH